MKLNGFSLSRINPLHLALVPKARYPLRIKSFVEHNIHPVHFFRAVWEGSFGMHWSSPSRSPNITAVLVPTTFNLKSSEFSVLGKIPDVPFHCLIAFRNTFLFRIVCDSCARDPRIKPLLHPFAVCERFPVPYFLSSFLWVITP